MSKKFVPTSEQLSDIKNLYINEYISTLKLADVYGVSKPTMNKLLKENGVELRKGGRYDTGFNQSSYMKKYQEDNKKKLILYRSEWGKNNRAKLKGYHEEWRNTNKETYNAYKRNYEKKKKDSDPFYKFAVYTRTAIWETLKTKKETGIFRFMPYTLEELIQDIQTKFTEGMTWENYGEWHLDHKKPISAFRYDNFEDVEFIECWSLTNLQPLWASTTTINGITYIGNLNKNNRY